MLIETTSKYRADSEIKAKDMIEAFRAQAQEKGYKVKKAGYEYKNKKSKGEIIAEAYLITVTFVYTEFWN